MTLGHVVTAAGIQSIDHRVCAEKGPEPPEMADFAFLFDEYQPPRLVGLVVGGLRVAFQQGLVDRLEQRRQALQAIGDRARRQVQVVVTPVRQQPRDRPMIGKLLQQNLAPHRLAQQSIGDELGRRRSREGALLAARAGGAIAFPANDTSDDLDLDLDLRRIFRVA